MTSPEHQKIIEAVQVVDGLVDALTFVVSELGSIPINDQDVNRARHAISGITSALYGKVAELTRLADDHL